MAAIVTESSAVQRQACRLCGSPVSTTFVDLGESPLCESFLTAEQCDCPEHFFPLHVRICDECLLVQLPAYVPPSEIFPEYAYFSAYSDSWVAHAERYAEMISERLDLGSNSLVVELGSNDGYLLQHFVRRGIPALGVDPAENVVEDARQRGVETVVDFFAADVARRLVAEGRRADLIVANNVLAQVPGLNDFVAGIEILLAPHGVATIEVPHILRLIEGLQFDTIYHEHYSYFSLTTLATLLSRSGLEVFDVEELRSHGGSLRVYVRRRDDHHNPLTPAVARILEAEHRGRYDCLEGYTGFAEKVAEVRWNLLEMLIDYRKEGKQIVGYGAPGKGNTLLNYCGIRSDLLEYTVDRNPYKHGRFLPGTHIPIFPPEHIAETRPDEVLILPWNLQREIAAQLTYVRDWGGELLVPIPQPHALAWSAANGA